MEEYPVYCGEKTMGCLHLTGEGGWVRAEMDCERDKRGVFRGVLLCRRGEIPLGVLEPVGDRLRLCKRISAREIEGKGGVIGGRARMSYAFRESWQRVSDGGAFFRKDNFSKEQIVWEGAMWRREGTGKLLAIPYEGKQPFPFCALFCFARIMSVCGRCCAVFHFDGEERPVMPGKGQ